MGFEIFAILRRQCNISQESLAVQFGQVLLQRGLGTGEDDFLGHLDAEIASTLVSRRRSRRRH